MLTKIKINGFKSFYNFEMVLTPLTVIAGANASGKSNLFDALKLLSRLADTDNIKKAFKEQRGEFNELFTQYDSSHFSETMEFEVEMLVNKTVKDAWGAVAQLKYTRLRYELKIKRVVNASGIDELIVTHENLINLRHQDDVWIKLIDLSQLENWRPRVNAGKRGTPYINTVLDLESGQSAVVVSQDGTQGNKRRFPLSNATRTVLSSFDTVDFPHVLAAKEEMKSWRFLELNPEDLRQPSNKSTSEDQITASGKNLAAALYRIKRTDPYLLKKIVRKLQAFVPDFVDLDVIDDVENKQFLIKLKDRNNREYSSRVLSEGTLRILALSILSFDDSHTGLLCFEEPENGVNPLRIQAMVASLNDLRTDFKDSHKHLRQVIVNTHSPTLIASLQPLAKDDLITIWLAELQSTVTDLNGERMKLNITSIKRADTTPSNLLDYPTKFTIAKLKEHLEIAKSDS
jgi:predicted ATPase